MPENFWWDVAANLIPDIVVALVFSLIVAIVLLVWQSRRDQSRQRKAEAQKTLDYILTLTEEVERLQGDLPQWRNAWHDAGYNGCDIGLTTPFWSAVDGSGDLPRLLKPRLVQSLAGFYIHIEEARRGRDLMQQSWFQQTVDNYKQQFHHVVMSNLETAYHHSPDLLSELIDARRDLQRELKIKVE